MVELERVSAFRELSDEGKRLLDQGVSSAACDADTMVLHKGQPVSGAYMVLKGRLRVFSLSPNGNEATLYFINPGETCVLALNCLFNDLLYPAWVQAEEATTVAVVPGPLYRQLFRSEPSIQELTVTALSTVVFRLMGELEQLHSSHHRQRLANFFLLHATADGVLQMTQQRLANHLGTTREVIARLMGEFVAEGIVASGRGMIRILDVDRLRLVVAPPLE
jgi:CRP/FNR family transcriptional regulator